MEQIDMIKNKLLVMSGKGGVGKTTIAVNIASLLNRAGYKVGLMDVDIHGPNTLKMLGLGKERLTINKDNHRLNPILKNNLKIVSVGLLADENKSIIWRGPLKHKLLNQFINDVDWGELDFLIIDFPPGTGDEHISTAQLLKDITGAIIISTPQQVAIIDSVRSIDFAKRMNIPIIGIIENMSGDLFGRDTVKQIAKENNIEFLGNISLDKTIVESCDSGKPFVFKNFNPTKELERIIDKIISFCKEKRED